jgi:hypothetical protein
MRCSHAMSERKSPLELLQVKIDAYGIDALTPSERWFYAICWFILETNGNAMHGYFFNHAGAYCREALQGLELVGAHRTADILRRAIALFPRGNIPVDHGARQVALGDLGENVEWGVLSRLTDELFAVKEGVAEMVESYVAAHRHEFPTLYAGNGSPRTSS